MAISGIASSKNRYFFAFSAAKREIFEKFRLQISSSFVGGAMLASS